MFRAHRRIIEHGEDCQITKIERLKTQGLSLRVQSETMRFKICDADRKLKSGELLLDHVRDTWVFAKQRHYPNRPDDPA